MNRTDRALTPRQKMVLQIIAARGDSTARDIEGAGFGLPLGTVYGALTALGNRGLVTPTGWDETNGRTYDLTQKGEALELEALEDE